MRPVVVQLLALCVFPSCSPGKGNPRRGQQTYYTEETNLNAWRLCRYNSSVNLRILYPAKISVRSIFLDLQKIKRYHQKKRTLGGNMNLHKSIHGIGNRNCMCKYMHIFRSSNLFKIYLFNINSKNTLGLQNMHKYNVQQQ